MCYKCGTDIQTDFCQVCIYYKNGRCIQTSKDSIAICSVSDCIYCVYRETYIDNALRKIDDVL